MKKQERFEMRVPSEFLELVDNWRREQTDIPSRAEAIRSLVLAGYVMMSHPEKVVSAMVEAQDRIPEGSSYFEDPIGSGLLAGYLALQDHVDEPKFSDEATHNVVEMFPSGVKRKGGS